MGDKIVPGESLRDCLMESLLRHREKKAISFLREGKIETEISYEGLDRDSNRMAHQFLDFGVRKGDRVILFLNKSLAFVVAYLALQKVGAITVPLNPGFKRSEMVYFLEDAGAKLVLSGHEQEAILDNLEPAPNKLMLDTEGPYQEAGLFRSVPDKMPDAELGPQDPALIVYTSGTTGKPKGAILTQENLAHDAKNVINVWEIEGSDVLCHALPLFHVHGLCFALNTALIAGARVIMLNKFSPERLIEVLSRSEGEYVCTLFMAVPPMYARMIDYLGEKRPDFGHVRLWTSGSAPLLVRDFERIRTIFGKEPVEREGMSETGMNFTNPIRGVRKPGSIGLPMPDLQVRIVDPETLVDVPPGRSGEIWLKGPGIAAGYWRKPEETARAFENGWFRSGDLGRVDEEGYFYLTDRLKHVIISGGENISPKEVENVINQFQGVVESAVVGLPDKTWGEKVAAAVVTRPGTEPNLSGLDRFCRESLHDWKCPKEFVFPSALPKNRMGKVLKEEIKGLFKQSQGTE